MADWQAEGTPHRVGCCCLSTAVSARLLSKLRRASRDISRSSASSAAGSPPQCGTSCGSRYRVPRLAGKSRCRSPSIHFWRVSSLVDCCLAGCAGHLLPTPVAPICALTCKAPLHPDSSTRSVPPHFRIPSQPTLYNDLLEAAARDGCPVCEATEHDVLSSSRH